MPYLFHERVPGIIPAPARALRPDVALVAAIVGTALVTVVLGLLAG